MSDARDRLVAAWSKLAKDAVAAAFAHYAVHSGRIVDPRYRFKVPSQNRCEPAATGTKGEVRVPIDPTRQPLNLQVSPIRLITDPSRSAIDASASLRRPPGPPQDSVLVRINPQLEVGTYVGFISDGSGPPLTYFVIYLDGL